MNGYTLGADAALDLDEIWEYIAADSVEAADRWIGRLFDTFEAIGKSPGIGHTRTDLTSYPVRFFPVGNYLIIYSTASAKVEIIAVTEGSRDIPSFLTRRYH